MNKSLIQLSNALRPLATVSLQPAGTINCRYYSAPADPMQKFKAIAKTVQKKPRILITGALGQLGRGLASAFRYMYGQDSVYMTDIVKNTFGPTIEPYFYLDILNVSAISEAVVNHKIDTIVHFSALLSAVGENNVPLALQVNGQGVQNILEVAKNHNLQVFIPSTIGAFGPSTPLQNTPDLCIQRPRTIYGVTKVFAELLGEYYNERFGVDFRSLRFPGVISATKPGGGTTDYAIQIFYDALLYGKHKCYLKPNTRLPMMYGFDCTASVVQFLAADKSKLLQRTYNVTGYSFTPEEIAEIVKKILPKFEIDYEICPIRQKIAESWPESLDDSHARKDWGWKPTYDLQATAEIMFQLIEEQLKHEKKI